MKRHGHSATITLPFGFVKIVERVFQRIARPLYSRSATGRLARVGRWHEMNSLDYYKIEELLTDEERAIRNRAAQFVQKEVLSEIVPCHRAAKFPDHLIPRMGALS